MSQTVEYYKLKADFISAYKANGNNIELALCQVSYHRDIEKEHIRTILNEYLKKFYNK